MRAGRRAYRSRRGPGLRATGALMALAAAAWLSPALASAAARAPRILYSRGASSPRAATNAWRGETQHPAVHQLTESYDRGRSSVLVRCVDNPTRASLDFAAWDGNGMRDAPQGGSAPNAAPTPLRDATFAGALVAGSAVDAIGDTALVASESSRPMSWRPAMNYLSGTNDRGSQSLAEAGWLVEGETWGANRPARPYQEIRRLFLRHGPDGYEAWVEIEFRRGVNVVTGVTDDDGDGFAELYGKLRPQFLTTDVADRLTRDYVGRALGAHDIRAWERELVAAWYGPYYATAVEASAREVIPNVDSDPSLRTALRGVTLSNPAVAIRAEPHGTALYTFLVVGCARP
jgi:hypothetical protein